MAFISSSTGQTAFKYAYEISPIILVGGIVSNYIAEPYLPIGVLTSILNAVGTLSGSAFAHYRPLPNSTLIDFDVAEYPFANLTMAGNAIVQNPLKLSMLMMAPANTEGSYLLKQAIFTLLQKTLQNHILQGGSFIVLTPAYTYLNCLMTAMTDVGSPTDKQVQIMYQLDFVQPLISGSQINSILSTTMSRIQNNLPTLGNWSGSVTWVPPGAIT